MYMYICTRTFVHMYIYIYMYNRILRDPRRGGWTVEGTRYAQSPHYYYPC